MTIRIRASSAAMITATGDWQDTPSHGAIWIGTHLLDTATISPALAETPENGDVLRIVDEGAPFDLTVAGAGEAAINAMISAGLDEVTATVSLHDGAPGADGTENEINASNNPGYVRITVPLESLVT